MPEREAAAERARFAAAAAVRPRSFADEERRQTLLAEWAARDPQGAIEFIRTQLAGETQARAMAAAISIWGKQDPAGAWGWLQKEMPTATHHFDNLLEVFGRNSPETAARYAAEFAAANPSAALEVHLAALLGVTHQGDFSTARALVDGNPALSPEVRGNLFNFIAGQWARFTPEEAAAWVLSLPGGPQRDQALLGLGESWSDVDPMRATVFAANLPPGEARTLAMRQGISKWVEADAEAARAWVLKAEWSNDFDQAVESIATHHAMLDREPARAVQWAATIFNDTLRANSLRTAISAWYPMDPIAATEYLKSSPDFTPEESDAFLARLRPALAAPAAPAAP